VVKAIKDSPGMRTAAILVMLTLLLCGCDGPRTAAMPRQQALRDDRVMRLQVVKVYDNKDLEWLDEYNISHVIDVDVLEGPPELVGKSLALPYDLFFMAKPPPAAGEVVVTAPADWVKRSLTGKVRGFGQ
jgi:hypothetical protein